MVGTQAASAKNDAAPELNHEAKRWRVVTPSGETVEVINLRRWLIHREGRAEGVRVYAILQQMSKAMRAGREGWITQCGWTIETPPEDKDKS